MIRFWALLALLGCVSPGAVSCPDGVVCPEGLECATVATVPYCVDKSQLGCADGEACAVGTCHEGVCLPNECGNSLVDLGEVCDDGNTTDDDMCSATCTSTNVCGNGIVDPVKAEQCDTGVAGMSGDGCASTCSVEALIWRDVTPRGVGARTGSVIAYDSKRGRAMLFGGRSAQAIHDDTWQYVTSTWIRRGTGRSAPGRSNAAMVYDVARDQLVLFGGFGGDFLGDTWTFDGGTWTQRVTATSPSARLSPAMAYHAARGETLLFGGQKATALGDSWVWNGAAWSELTSGVSPQPYGNPVMAYDPIRMEILYHGGANETWTWNGSWTLKSPTTVPAQVIYDGLAYSSTFDEMVMFSAQATYTWNGSDWQLRSTTTSPTAREGIAMSYAGPGGTILFGGNDQMFSPQTLYQETWGWSGADWSVVPQNPTTPPARQGHAMTYDARHGEIIMFGGGTNSGVLFGDTWRWSDASWSVAPGTGALQLARAYAALAYDSVRPGRVVRRHRRGRLLHHRHRVWRYLGMGRRRGQLGSARDHRSTATPICLDGVRCRCSADRDVRRLERQPRPEERHVDVEWLDMDGAHAGDSATCARRCRDDVRSGAQAHRDVRRREPGSQHGAGRYVGVGRYGLDRAHTDDLATGTLIGDARL